MAVILPHGGRGDADDIKSGQWHEDWLDEIYDKPIVSSDVDPAGQSP